MLKHPYQGMPEYTRWSKGIAALPREQTDPVVAFPFKVSPSERVATAGSCFAQHIARHLKRSGFTYYVVEDGHPLGSEPLREEFGYGIFSARYGNVYTTRQLLQLVKRAYGEFTPIEDHWQDADGNYIDPLRPNIQPGGFDSLEELRLDRQQHLRVVRKMFEELDYFVFTLGLTECWYDRRDGTVFPVCPGVAGGVYDSSLFGFMNLRLEQVIADMTSFLRQLQRLNPSAKVILTVSPVPLAATAMDRHVLVSTTYSKSVLRVACEELAARFDNVGYFPSYEIITGNYTRGVYFAQDLRSVTEEGVEHVMRLFFQHATSKETHQSEAASAQDEASHSNGRIHSDEYIANMETVVATLCDEELIEASVAR